MSDSYGLSVTNNLGTISISSEIKVLVFSERGTFYVKSQNTDRPGYGSYTFARPILSKETPQLFLRAQAPNLPSITLYTTMLGGPGNWTGFRVTTGAYGGSSLQNHLMEFVVCKYTDTRSKDEFGVEIYDKDGKISFSSSDKIIRYRKFTKQWSKSVGQFADVYVSGVAIDSDDFICVSQFDRGVAWFTDQANFASMNILTNWTPSLNIQVSKTLTNTYVDPTWSYFSIPICKFPIARYNNP